MAPKSYILACAVLALAVATAHATAVTFTDVAPNDSNDVAYTFGDSIKFTGAATETTYRIKTTIPLNTGKKSTLRAVLFNVDQVSNQFTDANNAPTVTPAISGFGFTSQLMYTAGSVTANGRFFSAAGSAGNACPGEYTITFTSEPNRVYGFRMEYINDNSGSWENEGVKVEAGASADFNVMLATSKPQLWVEAPSAAVAAGDRVSMKVSVTVANYPTDTANAYTAGEFSATLRSSGGTTFPTTTTANVGSIDFTFTDVPASAYANTANLGAAFFSIALPGLQEEYFNIKDNGNSRTGSVSVTFTSSTALGSTWTDVTTGTDAAYYSVAVAEGWGTVALEQQLGATADDTTYDGQNAGISYDLGDGVWRQYTGVISNPTYAFPTGFSLSNAKYISPVASFQNKIFVKVNCAAVGTLKLRAKVTDVQGECKSYKDCNVNSDDHPGAGFVTSLRGEQQFLRHCVALPSLTGTGVSTRCTECTSDCGCSGGSYCHTDLGLCSDASGNPFVCDKDSAGKAGLCVEKDPAGIIFGSSCRTSSGSTWTASSSASTYPPVLSASIAEASEDSPANDGTDFCGAYTSYNTSYVATSVPATSPTLAARSILWTGSCVEGVCRECTSDSCGSKTCLNGALRERIDVDQTIRTFSKNTVASTMLAAVFGLILLNLLFACHMCHAARSASK